MKLFIDDANVENIKRLMDIYPIDGVTTNPKILAKIEKDPRETLTEIRQIIGKSAMLFVQVLPLKAEEMVKDAEYIMTLCGQNTVVKIPSIPEGFKAIRMLEKEGISTCGTVVYTPMQALLAAKAGASYVAPYVSRIDEMGFSGIDVVKEIQNILDIHNIDCEVLAASFRDCQQLLELYSYGIASITATPEMIESLAKNVEVDEMIRLFASSFEKLTGKKKMTDLR